MNPGHYNRFRGRWSPVVVHNEAVYGFWVVGAFYNSSKGKEYYYGAYPPFYMDRIALLFPKDFREGRVLHLFSGTVAGDGARIVSLDINPEPVKGLRPTVVADAVTVGSMFRPDSFDLVCADPPYGDNHDKYGTEPFSKKAVVAGCSSILKPGGHLVWLDTIVPQWNKEDGWRLHGEIGLVQSTNHACRAITILEKKGPGTIFHPHEEDDDAENPA